MGKALAIIIAFAALLGISWGVTCAAVWAICALMHWTFTLGRRNGGVDRAPASLAALRSEALTMPAQKKHTNRGRL